MTLMWEVRAVPNRIEELVRFVLDHTHPSAEVYRGADRVVVIDPSGRGLTGVPGELMARPPQTWRFEQVPRADAV
jgi:hypothetical protein